MREKILTTLRANCSHCRKDLSTQLQKWHDYLAFEKQASEHTLYNYLLDLNSFFSFIKEHLGKTIGLADLSSLTLRNFRSYLAYRVSQSNSAASNKRAVSALKNFYRYLEKHTNLKNTALFELTSPKGEKKLPKPLPQVKITEISSLESLYIKQPKWIRLRDEALIMLLYGCGLRISEALNLDVKDLNPYGLKVKGKRKKERVTPMIPLVYEKLQTYLESRPLPATADSPLFLGMKGDRLLPRMFQKNMEKIRLAFGLPPTATPHSLRHSFASHLLAGGADLRSIQELLGHDSLVSTQVYTKLEDKVLFETYMKSHPRALVKTGNK